MNKKYDLVVIGGGAAGLFAVSVAKALKAKVCLVENKKIGGDCTWYGCVPSKSLIKRAAMINNIKEMSKLELSSLDITGLETSKSFKYIRNIVEMIGESEEPQVLIDRGIDVVIGNPQFIDKKTISVNGNQIEAKKFILATGSKPLVPNITGLNDIDYLTNETVFSLDDSPESMIILGGGPIGVEMAQSFARLGCKVSLVEMAERVLIREDEELVDIVTASLVNDGVKLYCSHKAIGVKDDNGSVALTVQKEDGTVVRLNAQSLLCAIGRQAKLESLKLENAGVEYSNRGVELNKYLQSTNKRVFACGDIASAFQFSHVAAYTAYVAVRNALFKRLVWSKVSYNNIVWATFTDPELAHLGLSETEANHIYNGKIKVYRLAYDSCDRAKTDDCEEGLLKVITNNKGYILGAHIVGSHAGELMQGFIIAKSQKIPLHKLASPMFIYPTLSELVKKIAAQALVEKTNKPMVKKIISLMKDV